MKLAAPIKDLLELTLWEPDIETLGFVVPLRECQEVFDDYGRNYTIPGKCSKVVYCHDMAGGYLQSDSGLTMTEVFPAFRFTRWHLIDIFIYFSHHFITIPPITWINLAHRQGVRVYGTLIFESFNETFKTIFLEKNSESVNYFQLAHKLDHIRRVTGFEGWLMNFEVQLPKEIAGDVVRRILNFLCLLKNLGSEIIWYDSVTRSGDLAYQNSLTEENEPFFRTGIDGIFTNYNWNEECLKLSQARAKSPFDSARVFIGIDCFGRGCPGGGGFSTTVALDMILNAMKKRPDRPLSIALFAPGWPFEKCDLSSAGEDRCMAHSLVAEWDDRFWAPLGELLSRIRGQSMGCDHLHRPTVPCLPVPCNPKSSDSSLKNGLILQTTCCTGQGLCISNGKPGSNMVMQQVIPTCRECGPCDASRGKRITNNVRSFQVLQYVCCGPVSPSGTCLSLRCLMTPISSDGVRFVELFTFPSGTRISQESVLKITLSLGIWSSSSSPVKPDDALLKMRELLGLSLYVDTIATAPQNSSQPECAIDNRCCSQLIPFKQVQLVPSNGDVRWVSLEFPLWDNTNSCYPADEFRPVSLHRVGLVWHETEHNRELLLGLIQLFDPSWIF